MKTLPDYYELLGLRRDEPHSPEEVKKAYRKALLSHHPDKAANAGNANAGSLQSRPVAVDDIALAYKTLSDPSLKAAYDRWLASNSPSSEGPGDHRIHHTGLETVDLDDLNFDESTQAWRKDCRCGVGGGYIVTEDELERNLDERELIVGCKGCSLWLRVLFSVEE